MDDQDSGGMESMVGTRSMTSTALLSVVILASSGSGSDMLSLRLAEKRTNRIQSAMIPSRPAHKSTARLVGVTSQKLSLLDKKRVESKRVQCGWLVSTMDVLYKKYGPGDAMVVMILATSYQAKHQGRKSELVRRGRF